MVINEKTLKNIAFSINMPLEDLRWLASKLDSMSELNHCITIMQNLGCDKKYSLECIEYLKNIEKLRSETWKSI